MNRRRFLSAGLAAGASSRAQGRSRATPDRPNIVFIMADDLGYGDLSCYGAEKVRTPEIDSLARQGVLFTDAHSPSAVCTPTRYGVLTGRYCWRTQLKYDCLFGHDPLLIEQDRPTVAVASPVGGLRDGLHRQMAPGLRQVPSRLERRAEAGPARGRLRLLLRRARHQFASALRVRGEPPGGRTSTREIPYGWARTARPRHGGRQGSTVQARGNRTLR